VTVIIAVLYLLCIFTLTGLGTFIFFKKPSALLNRSFALFAVTAAGWLATLYFFNRTPDIPILTLLGRANFAFAASFILFYYLQLPEIARKPNRYTRWLILETAVLVGLTLFTPLIDESEHLQNGRHVTEFGILFPLYIAHIIGYVGSALYLIFYAYPQKSPRRIRNQLSIIGLGIVLMSVIAIMTNIILPYFFKVFALQEVGALSIIALLGTIAYAISTHQLFDIRIIIRRTVVFTVLFVLIVIAYSILALLLRGVLLGGTVSDAKTNVVNLATICVVGFAVEPLRRWLTIRTDQFLFKREYNLQKVLTDLTTRLNAVVNLDEALETFLQTLVKLLHLRHAVLYVFQPGEGDEFVIKRIRQSGYRRPDTLMLASDHPLILYFLEQRDLILARDLETALLNEESALRSPERIAGLPSTFHREHEFKKAVHEKLVQLKAAVAIPLFLQEQPLGVILLSEKGSGDPYNEDDLALLEAIGSQAVSAIQKAKLYEDDQAKSEFVSIASHELLTPITAVQGYLSMVLEEDAKKIDPTLRSYTEKAFNSTRRLATLVKDLLSVSRIEAGRMQLDLQRVEIDHQIEQALDQLHFLAEEKKLALNFEKPAEPLPSVLADKDRVIEILINLIGNAIKYTAQGSVTIKILPDLHDKFVTVEIRDTGLGMSKEAQAHLFGKFYRVSTPETTGIMGTGLGLYITKSIVEKMGGTIEVESAPGKGSIFSFTLPVFQVQTAAATKPAKA